MQLTTAPLIEPYAYLPRDLFFFTDYADALDASLMVNSRLQPHLLGFGYSEAAD